MNEWLETTEYNSMYELQSRSDSGNPFGWKKSATIVIIHTEHSAYIAAKAQKRERKEKKSFHCVLSCVWKIILKSSSFLSSMLNDKKNCANTQSNDASAKVSIPSTQNLYFFLLCSLHRVKTSLQNSIIYVSPTSEWENGTQRRAKRNFTKALSLQWLSIICKEIIIYEFNDSQQQQNSSQTSSNGGSNWALYEPANPNTAEEGKGWGTVLWNKMKIVNCRGEEFQMAEEWNDDDTNSLEMTDSLLHFFFSSIVVLVSVNNFFSRFCLLKISW